MHSCRRAGGDAHRRILFGINLRPYTWSDSNRAIDAERETRRRTCTAVTRDSDAGRRKQIGLSRTPVYSPLAFFFGRSTAWMFGNTPPDAMVTSARSLFSSSSLRIASWI